MSQVSAFSQPSPEDEDERLARIMDQQAYLVGQYNPDAERDYRAIASRLRSPRNEKAYPDVRSVEQAADRLCFPRCVAWITGIPLSAWPEMSSESLAFWDTVEAVLSSYGWAIHRRQKGDHDPREAMIACGPGPRGVDHAIVSRDGMMLWDPHPSNEGVSRIHSYFGLIRIAHAASMKGVTVPSGKPVVASPKEPTALSDDEALRRAYADEALAALADVGFEPPPSPGEAWSYLTEMGDVDVGDAKETMTAWLEWLDRTAVEEAVARGEVRRDPSPKALSDVQGAIQRQWEDAMQRWREAEDYTGSLSTAGGYLLAAGKRMASALASVLSECVQPLKALSTKLPHRAMHPNDPYCGRCFAHRSAWLDTSCGESPVSVGESLDAPKEEK